MSEETPTPAPPPAAPETTPPPTAEAKPPEAPPPAPPPDPQKAQREREMAQRFAMLQRRERELNEKRSAIKTAEDRVSKAEQAAREAQDRLSRLKADPDGVLSEVLGPNYYDVLTETKLSGGKPPPDVGLKALEEKIEARFRAEAEARDRAEKERLAALEAQRTQIAEQQRQQVEAWRTATVDFVKGAGEQYELTNLYGAADEVPALIEGQYQRTGRILTREEAADLVEKHLEEMLQKATASKKYREKYAGKAPEAVATGSVPSAQTRTPTLSNNLTASTASSTTTANGPLSDEERFRRAIAAAEAVERARGRAPGV